MNNMTKVSLTELNGDYLIQYDESVGSRKLMKTSIFLDGIQGITHVRNNSDFLVSVNGLDEYAIGTVIFNILHYFHRYFHLFLH